MTWTNVPLGELILDLSGQDVGTLPQGVTAANLVVASDAMPFDHGYRHWPGLEATGTAAAEELTGAGNGVKTNGEFELRAGGATKLFRFASGAWADESRVVGGAYTGGTNNWTFAQFGTLLIACNGADTPQKCTIGSGTNFTDLGGTPPVAQYVAIVRDFVVMANISGATNRIQWSGINDAEDWTPSATTQSDSQDVPDEGPVLGIVGGEYGLVFFANAIYRMTYIGSPVIFQFDKISDVGLMLPMSLARHEDSVFFVAPSGFHVVRAGQQVVPIGIGKVDRFFGADIDLANIATERVRYFGAVDAVNRLYCLAYPRITDDIAKKMLVYHFPTGRWGVCTALTGAGENVEVLFQTNTGAGLTVAAINDSHKLAFWTGPNVQAIIETGPIHFVNGRHSFVRGLRPLATNVGTLSNITGAVVGRTSQTLSGGFANVMSDTAPNSAGVIPCRVVGLAHYLRLSLADSNEWMFQGWQVDVIPEGER